MVIQPDIDRGYQNRYPTMQQHTYIPVPAYGQSHKPYNLHMCQKMAKLKDKLRHTWKQIIWELR